MPPTPGREATEQFEHGAVCEYVHHDKDEAMWEGSIMCNPPRLYQGRDMTRYVRANVRARGSRLFKIFFGGHRFIFALWLGPSIRTRIPTERNGSTQLLSRPGVPIASPVPPPQC